MNLFGWLILGHFVADWLLQSDWMAIGKRRHFLALAGFVHYLIYTATILLVLYWGRQPPPPLATPSALAINLSIIFVGLVVFLSHWLVDGTNLIHTWMHLFRQRHQAIVYLVIDQTLHLLILGVVAAFLTQSCLVNPNKNRVLCVTKGYIAQVAQWIGEENSTCHYPPMKSE